MQVDECVDAVIAVAFRLCNTVVWIQKAPDSCWAAGSGVEAGMVCTCPLETCGLGSRMLTCCAAYSACSASSSARMIRSSALSKRRR
jgi:hypothetical protein